MALRQCSRSSENIIARCCYPGAVHWFENGVGRLAAQCKPLFRTLGAQQTIGELLDLYKPQCLQRHCSQAHCVSAGMPSAETNRKPRFKLACPAMKLIISRRWKSGRSFGSRCSMISGSAMPLRTQLFSSLVLIISWGQCDCIHSRCRTLECWCM